MLYYLWTWLCYYINRIIYKSHLIYIYRRSRKFRLNIKGWIKIASIITLSLAWKANRDIIISFNISGIYIFCLLSNHTIFNKFVRKDWSIEFYLISWILLFFYIFLLLSLLLSNLVCYLSISIFSTPSKEKPKHCFWFWHIKFRQQEILPNFHLFLVKVNLTFIFPSVLLLFFNLIVLFLVW